MATSIDPSQQFTKLCSRCAVFQLIDTPLDGIFASPNQERETDLGWEAERAPDVLYQVFHGSDCESCVFFKRILFWWDIEDKPPTISSETTIRLSLHHVFGPDSAHGYGLRAIRIKLRHDGQEDIHLDCPVTAVADDDTATLLALRPPLSHISKETKTFIPDRLIEVGPDQLRLVLTKDMVNPDLEIPHYIALTYCWGPEPHASKQLKTTSLNLSQHLQTIPESLLPQVIQDSVALARALSIPFLWVDALCILQDMSTDWDSQCAVMERIYGNAYVTVAAAASLNCEQGYLQKTDRVIIPLNPRPSNNPSLAFAVYSPLYKASAGEELVISPWLERGWTFQERITATRLLMFSRRNIHFKCPSFSESMGRDQDTYDTNFRMLGRDKLIPDDKLRTYQEWDETISQLNPDRAHFTRETDLLPSVAGLAALFQKYLGDEYLAGLWKNNLHRGLYWTLMDIDEISYKALLQRLESPFPYLAPSWSWASLRRYLCPHHHPRGSTEFGEVSHGALEMMAKVYVGTRRIVYRKVYPAFSSPQNAVRLDGEYFAHIRTDCIVEDFFTTSEIHELIAPIGFLLIGSTIRRNSDANYFSSRHSDSSLTLGDDQEASFSHASSDSESTSAPEWASEEVEDPGNRTAYGLLIHPTGNPDEYYRVGTFLSKPFRSGGLSIFNNLELRRVRLI
ncbi:HET domain-containing protein [Fusarium falciforme]|uniref:HET domain-containing protein n=1 Tax=Fusarium falciforme TaxID=195108 RepID=UPI002301694E|nr:HET domain-containing protein [Fusarium falciforme]WAO84837.1 HET domain-containing protein [Fusarium falciforme]